MPDRRTTRTAARLPGRRPSCHAAPMSEMSVHWWLTGPRRAEERAEERPSPGPGDVLVEIAYTALSPGSNVFAWRTGSYTGSPRPEPEELLYMGSGTVRAIGSSVGSIAVGDRVVLTTGHQAWTCAREQAVHRVPDGLDLRSASLSYLSGWSVSALHLGGYRAAETVVVMGLGLVGASAAAVADLMGARVVALDVDAARIAFGQTLGLESVVRVGTNETRELLAAVLDERGPDLVIETTGNWAGLREAIGLARDYTRIAIMGIYREPPPADLGLELFSSLQAFPAAFHYKRLQLIGVGADPAPDDVSGPTPYPFTTRSNFAYVLGQAARGRLHLDRLVTDVFPSDRIGPVLERIAGGDSSMVGVVFDWTGSDANLTS